MAKVRDARGAAEVPPAGGGGFAAFSKRSQALGEFERVVREKKTGALRITGGAGASETTLWLSEGVVVWAEGGNLSERLGRIMVAHELLSWDEYAAALDSMASRQEARLGELVSDLRMAKREQVVSALHLQVRLRAAAALSDLDASATFDEVGRRSDRSSAKDDGEFPTDLSLLYVDISKRLDDRDVKKVLEPLAHQYARVKDPTLLGTAPEALRTKMRSLVDVHEIVQAQSGERALFMGMLLADALELADAPFPGKRIEDEVPDESEEPSGMHISRRVEARGTPVDGLKPDPSSPEQPAAVSSESLGNPDPSNIAKLKLNRVQLSVRKVPDRNPWDDRDASLLSEMHYVNARALCRVAQWPRALIELQKAHTKAPAEMEYAVLLAYVKWKSVQASAPNEIETAQGNLEALLGEALATSHSVAIVHFVVAELAVHASDLSRALAAYRRALALEPTFVDAAQKARQVERRLATEGKPKPAPRPAKPELVVEPVREPAHEPPAAVVPAPRKTSAMPFVALAVIAVVLAAAWFALHR